MPRKSAEGSTYPKDWPAIARAIKDACGWICVRCGAEHQNRPGYTLTVHHLDMDPSHSAPDRWWWNCAPLCCKCHLQIQHKVVLDRPWTMTEHTPWFRPYVAGFYAYKYLGLHLSRAIVERHLDYLLTLEFDAVIGGQHRALATERWRYVARDTIARDGAGIIPVED